MHSNKNNGNLVIWNLFILTLSACILLLFYGSTYVFYAALVIGTVICIINFIKLIRCTSYVRFGNLLATSLLFYYAGGGLVTVFSNLLILGNNFSPINIAFGPYEQGHISLSLAFVFFTSAVLFLVSKAEKPIFANAKAPLTDQRIYRLLLLGFALVLTALLSGEMGYMGIQVNEVSK